MGMPGMDMSGMSGSMTGMGGSSTMGGMDGADDGMFKPAAFAASKTFWYIIIGCIGFGFVANILRLGNGWLRLRENRRNPTSRPTVPKNRISQAYATTLALCREMTYPQGFYVTKEGFGWLTPPSLGRCLLLVAYWITIVVMLTSNAIVSDAFYYERLGFRAAWICVMQVPLVILLAGKFSIIGLLVGSSYEKLNWLHRWVSRTLFLCVTFHGSFFLAEWVKADFVAFELEMMPMVKYGMGAWSILLWMNLSGLAPVRRIGYEFFVVQHLISTAFLLWMIFIHCPAYAQFYVWTAIGFVAFDRIIRAAWFLYRNTNALQGRGVVSTISDRIGYRAELRALSEDITAITIHNVPFNWKPGQHLFVRIPEVGFFDAHPFTISNVIAKDGQSLNTAHIAVRAHSGFSKRLHRFASKTQSEETVHVRAFLQGPFGAHPSWNTFESLVLISASTGCSFTLPILESVVQDPGCVRHVTFMLLVRQKSQCVCYMQRLRETAARASAVGVLIDMQVVVTGGADGSSNYDENISSQCVCGKNVPSNLCCCYRKTDPDDSSRSNSESEITECCTNNKTSGEDAITTKEISTLPGQSQTILPMESSPRPDLLEYIRRPVEAAGGETCVAVCGGRSLTCSVRNVVARLSDERAVHKGTGAQGICLYVEEFAF